MNQENTRSKFQQKIAADLAEKSKKKLVDIDKERPDGIEDSAYLKNTKRTSSLAWVWILIAFVAIVVLIWLVVASL